MRKLLYAGATGPLIFIAVFLIAGATRPGYSSLRNMVSQLATGDGGWVQVANFLVLGTLMLAFATGLRQTLKGNRGSIGAPVSFGLFGVALLVAGIFVTDPGLGYPVGAPEVHTTHGIIHGFSGLAAFLTLASAAFAMSWHFSGEAGARAWVVYSVAIGALIFAFFFGSFALSAINPATPGGLLQRITIIGGWTWIAAVAVHVLRGSDVADRSRDEERARAADQA